MRCLYGLVSTWGGAAKERRERRKKEGGCALGPKSWFMRPDNEVAVSNCLCSLGYLQADQSARMWSGSKNSARGTSDVAFENHSYSDINEKRSDS